MRGRLIISLCIALAAGVWIGVFAPPWLREANALRAIVSDDASTRDTGWAFLLDPTNAARLPDRIDSINTRLLDASDEALIEAASQLDGKGLWSWKSQPAELMWRFLRSDSLADDARLVGRAASWMDRAPLDLPVSETVSVFDRLIGVADGWAERDMVDALLAWLGPERLDRLGEIAAVPSDDFARVSLSIAREIRHGMPSAGAFRRDPAEVRAIACDDAADPKARLIALWMLDEISEEDALAVLDDLPALDARGSAARFALVAERVLSKQTAERVSREWLLDYDDGRKRAGALLAALSGVHREVLTELLEREDHPSVRTTYRLSLDAMGALSVRDPEGFAHRVLRPVEGFVNAESVVALLIRGRGMPPYLIWNEEGLSMLAGVDLQMLIRRFYPELTESPVTRHYGRVEFVVWRRALGDGG